MHPSAAMNAIRSGKAHQVYGISDFNQKANHGAMKYNAKFQSAIAANNLTFRRKNGEFTNFSNVINSNKFWLRSFQKFNILIYTKF